MAKSKLQIEYVPLGELKRWPRNPKEHDLGAIHSSIRRFGYVMPILVDESTGQVVAGHGRIDALQQMKAAGQSPPGRIIVRDGEWLVPAIKGVQFAGDLEAEAYALADNRLVELGGWDDEALAQVLADLASADLLEGIGWDADDVDELLASMAPPVREDPGAEIDRAEELREKWQTEPGQIWEIDKHRVMCGDSTKKEDVERLMRGETPLLMATDPPYGVRTDHSWRDKALHQRPTSRGGILVGDDRHDWREVYPLFDCQIVYVWHSGLFGDVVKRGLEECGYEIRQQIIWVKTNFPLGRAAYHWRHEPCWYAVKKGATGRWLGDRTQTTVWEAASPIWGKSPDESSSPHPTEKPVLLFATPIRNHLHRGESLVDPFLGSGTAMVAAEQTGRICYGMEIDPKYAAVTLERMAGMGPEPRLAESHD